MAKRLITWVVVIAVLGLVIWGLVVAAKRPIAVSDSMLATPVAAIDQLRGNPEAQAVLVEYSDFQCPACAFYSEWINQLSADFDGSLAIVYRHFPLRNIHPNAELAARASEAAGRQGQFWEMSDKLFDFQESWSGLLNPTETFVRYASELGLNLDQFRTDLESAEIARKVDDDFASGVASGVSGTPTFFLNGEQIQNPRSYEEFASLVEAKLDAQN